MAKEALGNRLKVARAEHELSQEQLALRLAHLLLHHGRHFLLHPVDLGLAAQQIENDANAAAE